jgi:hypothetical protein
MKLDDIEKAISYVIVILPGFLCLGLVVFLTDIKISEFHFIYISIALTLFLYGVGQASLSICKNICSKLLNKKSHDNQVDETLDSHKTFNRQLSPFVFGYSILCAFLITYFYEDDVIINIVRKIEFIQLQKVAHLRPLRLVFNDLHKDRILHSDDRLIKTGDKAFIRVYVKNVGYYEGFPKWFPSRNDPDEIYMTPACVSYGDPYIHDDTNLEQIKGPGVYISGANIQAIEFLDPKSNSCYCLFYSKLCKK